jgi:predicted O-methyltransferase YrrM
MNSLQDPRISRQLAQLHAAAMGDKWVYARAIPKAVGSLFTGRRLAESASHHLRHAYLPVTPEKGRALYQTARAMNARRIVEFGASFGVSTIYLAAAVRDNGGGEVITTEIEPNKIAGARENYRIAGFDDLIALLEGDALQTLRSVEGVIDMVFLDGWKPACLPVLKLLEPKLRPGSAVFCDNIGGFRKTLKPYVDHVRQPGSAYSSILLPLGDGMEYSVLV